MRLGHVLQRIAMGGSAVCTPRESDQEEEEEDDEGNGVGGEDEDGWDCVCVLAPQHRRLLCGCGCGDTERESTTDCTTYDPTSASATRYPRAPQLQTPV